MQGSSLNNKNNEAEKPEVDFHQATVINEKGEEIAITEKMVRKAIHQLDDEAYPESELEQEQEQ